MNKLFSLFRNERGIQVDAYYVQGESPKLSTYYPFIRFINKPVMIYYFVNPLCKQCWSVEVAIKKLTMKYGTFFNLRPIISHSFTHPFQQNGKQLSQWHHYHLSVGIKAAGLQGNKAGRDFLRNIQETIFLYESSASVIDIIHQAAKHSGLDMHEFQKDLYSDVAIKAYQGDIDRKSTRL